jgi:hypothetical protein
VVDFVDFVVFVVVIEVVEADSRRRPVLFTPPQGPAESAGVRRTPADSGGLQQCDFFVTFCHILLHYWTPWTPADSGRIGWTTNSILSIEGALMITY